MKLSDKRLTSTKLNIFSREKEKSTKRYIERTASTDINYFFDKSTDSFIPFMVKQQLQL